MDFLYPNLVSATHTIKNNNQISETYPSDASFFSKKDLVINTGTQVIVIRENIGINCEWSLVKYFTPENIYKQFYIPKTNLTGLNSLKQTYIPICSFENTLNSKEPEVDPRTKEIFLPYIDKRNGFYSVRIQVEEEKIVDSLVFNALITEVLYEGISLLLSSRGYRSDNEYISSLINKYYTFAYIANDLDVTVQRLCEPLTFTVSIPLNFFNENLATRSQIDIQSATKFIKFNNKNIRELTNILIRILSSRTQDIFNLIYPNKILDNFIVDVEVDRIRKFAANVDYLTRLSGYPLSDNKINNYEIGLTNNLDLVYIKASDQVSQSFFNDGLLSQARLRPDFNSKRVFNYLLEANNMNRDIRGMNIQDFLETYVKFPEANLISETVKVGRNEISGEKLSNFRISYEKSSKNCVTAREFGGAVNEALIFTDPLYHLFVKQDVKNFKEYSAFKNFLANGASYEQALQEAKKQPGTNENPNEEKSYYNIPFKERVVKSVREGYVQQVSDLGDIPLGAFDAAQTIVEKRFSISGLLYILNRINLTQVIFSKLLCELKGLDPNDQETVRIASQIPFDILNYFNYIQTFKNLRGTDLIRALSSGMAPNYNLFCSSNETLIYYLKAIKNFIRTFNVTGALIVEFKNEGINKKVQNPWAVFTKSLILQIEQITVETLIDIIKENLTNNCEDPILDNNNENFRDVFATHVPSGEFNNTQINNSQEVLDNNRLKVLENVYFREVQFGFDREYIVDIIDLLLKDLSCILMPIESLALLRGDARETVMVLVKNLIKAKYSQAPNDLTFLINDENKLKQFFRELGLTIDQEYFTKVEEIINTRKYTVYVDRGGILCPEDKEDARRELNEIKIPKNLDALNRQRERRKRTAEKLLEQLRNGNVSSIDIKPLCPDFDFTEGGQLTLAKSSVLESYTRTVKSSFTPIIESFTSEVNNFTNAFAEKKTAYKTDGSVAYDYYLFNSTLGTNFENLTKPENLSYITDASGTISYKYKYFAQGERDIAEFTDNFFAKGQVQEFRLFCPAEQQEQIPQELADIINSGSLFANYTRIADFALDERNINQYKNQYKDSELGKILNSKEYFIVILLNRNEDTKDVVQLNFYYNDKLNNKFTARSRLKSSEDGKLITNSNQTYSSDDFLRSMVDKLSNNIGGEEVVGDFSASDVFKITDLNQLDDNHKVVINSYYYEKVKFEQETIKNYNFLLSLINEFNGLGLFNAETKIEPQGNNKFKIKKTLNVSSGLYSEALAAEGTKGFILEEIPYFSSSLELNKVDLSLFEEIIKNPELPLFKEFIYKENPYIKKDPSVDQNTVFENEAPSKTVLDLIFNRRDYFLEANSKLALYNYTNDIQYKKCNIYPHYLNLDYVVSKAIKNKQADLCDINNFEICDIISTVLVELTIRTHITDLLVKSIPYLTKIETERNNFWQDKIWFDVIKSFLKREMKIFSSETAQLVSRDEITSQNSQYYKYFALMCKQVYKIYERNGILVERYIDNTSQEKEIDYFIKKEIQRFFRYSDDRKIIKYSKTKLGDQTFNNFDEFINYAINEYFKIRLENLQAERQKLYNEIYVQYGDPAQYGNNGGLVGIIDGNTGIKSAIYINDKELYGLWQDGFSANRFDPESTWYLGNPGLSDPLPVERIRYEDFAFTSQIGYERRLKYLKNTLLPIQKKQYDDASPADKAGRAFAISSSYEEINRIETKEIPSRRQNLIDFKNQLKGTIEKRDYLISNSQPGLDSLAEYDKAIGDLLFLQDGANRDFLVDLFKTDFKFFLSYILAANTIDYNKRTILYSTKSNLAQLFFRNINCLYITKDPVEGDNKPPERELSQQDANKIKSQNVKSTSDIISFIESISTSPEPAIMIAVRPEYSKYTKYYVEKLLAVTRNTLSIFAEATDPNIKIAKSINRISTRTAATLLSLLDDKAKEFLALNDVTLISKRLLDGRSVLPDLAFSVGVAASGIIPGISGISYLAVDSIEEAKYIEKLIEEFAKRKKEGQEELDPCTTEVKEITKNTVDDLSCTPEKIQRLTNTINQFEE